MSGPQLNCRVQGRMLHLSSGGSQIRNTVLVLASFLGFWPFGLCLLDLCLFRSFSKWCCQIEKLLAKHQNSFARKACWCGTSHNSYKTLQDFTKNINKHLLCSALVFFPYFSQAIFVLEPVLLGKGREIAIPLRHCRMLCDVSRTLGSFGHSKAFNPPKTEGI